MKKKDLETMFLAAFGLVAVGVWLASRPTCDHGCQTVAEHLIHHGIRDGATAVLMALV